MSGPSPENSTDWAEQLSHWAEVRDVFYRRFDLLTTLLQAFVTERVLLDTESARQIAAQFEAVLAKCDDIKTYDTPGAAEAYAILHFLLRYLRSQVTYQKLFAMRLLPVKPRGHLPRSRGLTTLDIGTGPGPAMYALADTYAILRRFGEDTGIHLLRGLNASHDYVEQSAAFRHWLHHFTEYANDGSKDWPWLVPFHHGTFDDFRNMEYDHTWTHYRYSPTGLSLPMRFTRHYRFDLVMFNNFLTTEAQVLGLTDDLRRCAAHLRNRGLLLLVGARHTGPKYEPVYRLAADAVLSENYSNDRFEGSCEKALDAPLALELDYSPADRFWLRLREFYRAVHARMTSLGAYDQLPKKTAHILDDYASRPTLKSQWSVLPFLKKSRPREDASLPPLKLKRGRA